jgi:hypothetical protein
VKRAREERRRWPYQGAPQRALLFAAAGVFLAAALPWALVLGRWLWGSPLAISWVLWAGLMTVVAAWVPWRAVVVVSALAGGGTAVGFAVWQTARIFDVCPLSLECLPGPGVGVLLAAGGAALYQAVQLLRGAARA